MAASHERARSLATVWRTEPRSRESTGQISVASPLLATSFTHRGCVSHTISAAGKDSRSPATAGKVCTISPSEPRRTTTKRCSVMRTFSNAVEKRAGGVILRIAYDSHSNPQTSGNGTLRNILLRIVRSFRVYVRAKLFEQGLHMGLRKKQNVIHIAQGADQLRARLLIQNRPARSFQIFDARVRIHRNNQNVALLLGPGEVPSMADMQRI